MIAKWPGSCYICHKAITPGKDIYEPEYKRSSHAACHEAEESQPPSREQFELADVLGYRTSAEWDVLLLPAAANGDAAWWDRREARDGHELSSMFSSDTIETITGARGSQGY